MEKHQAAVALPFQRMKRPGRKVELHPLHGGRLRHMRRFALLLASLLACSSPATVRPAGPVATATSGDASTPRADAEITRPVPPVAARIPHDVVSLNGTRDDPYYWLRDDTR